MLIQDFQVETLSAYEKLTKSPISKNVLEIEPTSNLIFSRQKLKFAFKCTLNYKQLDQNIKIRGENK